jgi:hypothetical protein
VYVAFHEIVQARKRVTCDKLAVISNLANAYPQPVLLHYEAPSVTELRGTVIPASSSSSTASKSQEVGIGNEGGGAIKGQQFVKGKEKN